MCVWGNAPQPGAWVGLDHIWDVFDAFNFLLFIKLMENRTWGTTFATSSFPFHRRLWDRLGTFDSSSLILSILRTPSFSSVLVSFLSKYNVDLFNTYPLLSIVGSLFVYFTSSKSCVGLDGDPPHSALNFRKLLL